MRQASLGACLLVLAAVFTTACTLDSNEATHVEPSAKLDSFDATPAPALIATEVQLESTEDSSSPVVAQDRSTPNSASNASPTLAPQTPVLEETSVQQSPSSVSTLPPPHQTGSVGHSRQNLSCISNPHPQFTAHISDLSKVAFISPTIVASGNWLKNRSYLVIAKDANQQTYELPVYAPSDATLIGVTDYLQPMQNEQDEWVNVPQYDIRFQASCEVTYGFDHLSRLSDAIAALAPTEPSASTRNAEVPTDLPVKAGELLGYTIGTIRAHTWDFYLSNTTKRNQFANQERCENVGDLNRLLTGDCPYEYFDQKMAGEYYALFGGWSGKAASPSCKMAPDQVGTIAGGWFNQPFSPDGVPEAGAGWGMTIVEAADGEVHVNDERQSVRVSRENPTYADPKTVTREHCYQHTTQPDRYAYLNLLSDDEMAAAFGDGSCPAQMPSEFTVYYR